MIFSPRADPFCSFFNPLELGVYGETILHISVLYANDKVAMYIGDTYPELISCQYTKQPYLGTWPPLPCLHC